jgi:hypothetical protein
MAVETSAVRGVSVNAATLRIPCYSSLLINQDIKI